MSNGNTNGFVRRAAATVLGFLAVVTVVLALVVRTVSGESRPALSTMPSVIAFATSSWSCVVPASAVTDWT